MNFDEICESPEKRIVATGDFELCGLHKSYED